MRPTSIVLCRRISQIFFLLLFVALFIFANSARIRHSPLPVDIYLRADPLIALTVSISTRTVLWSAVVPSLVIVFLTLLMGRVFCGWICPLGATFDIADRLLLRRHRAVAKSTPGNRGEGRWWKYVLLFAILASSVFAFSWVFLLDPLCLATRVMTVVLYPASQFIWNASVGNAQDMLYRLLRLDTSTWITPQFHYYQNWLIAGIFIFVVLLSLWQERFWCRNLCPLGALLGLLSRFSLLRHRVSEHCNHCSRCETHSRTGAYRNLQRKESQIPSHDLAECVQCFRCASLCPQISISLWRGGNARLPQPPFDIGRRRLIGALGVGAAVALIGKTTTTTAVASSRRIRPPGALPEEEFLSACVRCGECMKVCPSNGLQPAWLEAGLEGLWSPILVPRIGPCVEQCTLCGQVCPTDALQTFTFKDKRDRIRLGLAEVDKDRCIAYEYGKVCIVCAEVCSYQAVVFKDEWDQRLRVKKRVPVINMDKCTGCGICEKQCPVIPERAIRVSARNERRLPRVVA